ncbi:glycoside hydrolase [Brachionus plicatilis]|uniref:Glycoside hydrolase n=1 Tax=Brachionus plicatilis TaxID=10195 RepID=A0A3M7STK2_BRAPC|nr:glycoside hydrolase [Brachionus plicatilis]
MQLMVFRILCLLKIFIINDGHIFEKKKIEINETKNGITIKSLYLISKINTGLVNYWPIENGTTNDLINLKNMHSPFNAEFTEDRFGNPNSAITLNHGYMTVPGGIYFGSAFTILAWVKIKSYEKWQRFLDFGNEGNSDNILIKLSDSLNRVQFRIYNGESEYHQMNISTNMVLQLNRWYHLGFVQINGKMSIYVDGNREANSDTEVSNLSRIIERTNCYFGKSNFNNDPNGNFVYDEIKFFDKELIDEEIKRTLARQV